MPEGMSTKKSEKKATRKKSISAKMGAGEAKADVEAKSQ